MILSVLFFVSLAYAQWNLISGEGAPVLSTGPNAKIAPNANAMWCSESDIYILNQPYLWKYETTGRWLWQPNPPLQVISATVAAYWNIRNSLWVLMQNAMCKYTPATREWECGTGFAGSALGGGAFWTHEYSNRLYLYANQVLSAFDVTTQNWQTIAQSNTGPSLAQNVSAVLGNSEDVVYVYAGDKMWRLSLATFAWQEMGASGPPGPNRAQYAFWRQGSKLIMFGGQSGSKVFDDTWSYDTIGDKWQQITSGTPFARYGSLTCPEGYLFGAAASNRNDLWIYGNPPSQTNTLRISLPDGAIFLSAVASTLTLLLMILVTLIACVQCCKKRASLKKAEEFINV